MNSQWREKQFSNMFTGLNILLNCFIVKWLNRLITGVRLLIDLKGSVVDKCGLPD